MDFDMEARLAALELASAINSERILRTQSDLEGITRALRELTDAVTQTNLTLSSAKGGWRMLILVGSAVAGAASTLAFMVQSFSGK